MKPTICATCNQPIPLGDEVGNCEGGHIHRDFGDCYHNMKAELQELRAFKQKMAFRPGLPPKDGRGYLVALASEDVEDVLMVHFAAHHPGYTHHYYTDSVCSNDEWHYVDTKDIVAWAEVPQLELLFTKEQNHVDK